MSVSNSYSIAFLDHADGNAGDRIFDFYTRSHQSQRRAANGRHRRRSVGFKNVGDDADRVREIIGIGQNWFDGSLGQCTVSNFTSSRATNRSAFAHAETGEVVIEHEFLRILVDQAVDSLFVSAGSQSNGNQGLCFASLEDGRTVHSRNEVDLTLNRPQRFAVATIGAIAGQNRFAYHLFFEVVNRGFHCPDAERVVSFRIGDHLGNDLVFQFVLGGASVMFAGDQYCGLVIIVIFRD